MTSVKMPDSSNPPVDTSGQALASAMSSSTTLATQGPADVVMSDAPSDNAPSPVPVALSAASPIPPPRTGTPSKQVNGQGPPPPGQESSSRAASAHPDPGFTMPAAAPPHGHSARQYLNSKVTPTLMEGLKQIAREQPKDPLRALGEYLLQRSKELETSS